MMKSGEHPNPQRGWWNGDGGGVKISMREGNHRTMMRGGHRANFPLWIHVVGQVTGAS